MPRDARAYLWDASQAAQRIAAFTEGRTLLAYEDDVLVRSAVERQLEILGESLNQLSKLDPDMATRIPDLRAIVGLRNILIHGYAAVDDALVWQAATVETPQLLQVLRDLLPD